jgi:hypothetical protein
MPKPEYIFSLPTSFCKFLDCAQQVIGVVDGWII